MLKLAIIGSSSMAKSMVFCIVSRVSPGRPMMKKPIVSIPAALAFLNAWRMVS